MGGNAREWHSLSAVTPNRPSINVRILPPEHLAHLQCSTLHQVPSFRSCSRGVTATDGHAEAPDSVRARHSGQINAPVSLTLI
jgi:hypothetical protein